MATMNRRQIFMGAGALLGAGVLPGLMRQAVGEELARPDHLIRAGTNENPWAPSRVALQAIVGSIDQSNKYGGIEDEMLRLIAGLNQVDTANVAIGTGSGEILNVAGLLASMDKGSIVCADPTYHGVVRYAERAGSKIIRVPVDENLNTDLDAMMSAIRRDTSLVYLVNPNNPIPSIIEMNALREFVREVARDRLVFVDEAYYEFVDHPDYESMMDLVRDGQKNLIVTRTASKIHGLAGLRVGFGFAHPDLARSMNERKTGQTNILGMQAAYASYQDQEFQDFTLRKNRESLAIVEGMCEELGIRYVKSNANFTFLETGIEIDEVSRAMLDNGIIVGRPFPPMTRWLRVSMAKPDEMRYFVQTYKRLFS
jgi:histidinol-phosphate aminotransferase